MKKKKSKLKKHKNKKKKRGLSKKYKVHIDSLDFSIEKFFTKDISSGDMVEVISRGVFTSHDTRFNYYMDKISNHFFKEIKIPSNTIYRFIILIHEDNSADVFLNEFGMEFKIKKDIYSPDELEIQDLEKVDDVIFSDFKLKETDKFIFGFKEHWDFALFFYLSPFKSLDLSWFTNKLMLLIKRMRFDHFYSILENNLEFMKMKIVGWFPFVELLENDFEDLNEIYKDEEDYDPKMARFISRFDKTRIDKITIKWWENPIFGQRQPKIEDGIASYLRGDKVGFVNCLKIILKETEEIIRLRYFRETGKGGQVSLNYLLTYLIERGKTRISDRDSMFIPDYFYKYLKEIVFGVFNFEKDNLTSQDDLNKLDHPASYLKMRALQTILVLDQIYFYL